MSTSYVTPQAGSGSVNLRSEAVQDPSTLPGALDEGVKPELNTQGNDWNTAKVYVAEQVTGSSNGLVSVLPGWDSINIRLAPSADPTTDVGDLNQSQRLELIGGPSNG